MDFMFEDEVDEVGSDVEAYCPKCKGDTTHVVISKYEDEIRRVQCNPCGDVHSFRKPRGDVEDDVPEPIAAKKRAMMKKQTWEEFFAKHSDKNAKPYEFREHYHENVIVTHPKFGVGFVSEILSDSKAEITFKDARRVLVHNRKDMHGLPLAAEGDGHPSDTKISKLTPKPDKSDKSDKAAKGKDAKPVVAKESKPAKELAKEAAAGHAKDSHPKDHPSKDAKESKDAKAPKDSKSVAAKAPPAKPAAARAHAEKIVPAAKASKRSSKPPRPMRAAAPAHGRSSSGKAPAKAAKRHKK
ncbi:MAG TPA: hypothetical protein VHH90_02315 [Polyangia bacterium]|nr:hypothetical protein [Polyangia bacterium]